VAVIARRNLSALLVAGAALAAAASACLDGGSTHPKPVRLRVAYTSDVDVGDLPSLIASRTLAEEGYQVEPTFFARPELAVEALARGDAEFANGGTRAFWAAAAKGADVVLLMEHSENGYQIVARRDITTCRELGGRTLALSSRGALPTTLAEAYLQGCAPVRPHVLAIPHSSDRLAAVAAGAVDAAVLQRADVARLEQRAPGRFRVLVGFGDAFRDLALEGVFANGAFARAHRDVVVEYVRARIEANRRALANPELLFEEARHWPTMGTLGEGIVNAEVQAPAWPRDGGASSARVAATFDFFVSAGSLPAMPGAGRLADRSYLEEALQAARPPAEGVVAAPGRHP
jgi:NitT/TauT family transport system substrate-binding protein